MPDIDMTDFIRLLHHCDGELSAVAYRGTYDKQELIDLSHRLRVRIPVVDRIMASARTMEEIETFSRNIPDDETLGKVVRNLLSVTASGA